MYVSHPGPSPKAAKRTCVLSAAHSLGRITGTLQIRAFKPAFRGGGMIGFLLSLKVYELVYTESGETKYLK